LPVIDLLRGYFNIQDRDDPRKIREKVTGKLLTFDKTLESTLPAVLSLLDVPVNDAEWETLDPPQRRQRTLETIKRLLLRETQVQPLLLVLEDLHWIDSETQTLLDSLIDILPTARLLLLVNYRPEYQHAWGNKTYYTQLRVDPLPAENAGQLMTALLGNHAALEPLKRILLDRTEGNAFFIEESVRALVETKFLVGERGSYRLEKTVEGTQMPATVQAVLAARIDRLPPEEKRLLQSAAVVGKDVPFPLLQAIADPSAEELRHSLARLQAAEFLYETSLFPDLEYTFKHALTHEVAYGSLLQERRRALHAKIVESIEQLYPDRLSEHVELLAHHASRGELWEKAVEYLHQAGKKAASRSASHEAIAYFEQALTAVGHLPDNRQTIERAIHIRVELGPLLIVTLSFAAIEVEENYKKARELCDRIGNTANLFPILWGLARMHDSRGELRRGQNLGEQLLHLAQEAGDSALLLEAHHELWANLSIQGELVSARLHIEQGFALYDRQKHRHHAFLYGGHDPAVCCTFHSAEVLWLLGYPDQALQKSRDSLELGRELSHSSTMSFALAFAAWFHQFRGEQQVVQERVEEGIRLATEKGFALGRANVRFLEGWLVAEGGQWQQGITQMSNFLTERARGSSGRWMSHCAALLADAYRKSGQPAEGLEVVIKALARVDETDCRYYEAELHRIRGELLLMQSTPAEEQAESCFQKAIDVARSQSAKSWELRAAVSLSRRWRSQGKKSEARKLLADVYNWFTEGFDTADLIAAKALLDELA
jgi:predicted ATPase